MIQADLHIHTTYSFDSTLQPKVLVQNLINHNSIKVVAITDHNTIEACSRIQEMVSPYHDILIIPGVEIGTAQGDILVLGVEEMPSKPWTVESVIDFAKSHDGVSVVAHPYREFGLGDLARDYVFDAVEVVNGASSASSNELAQDLAKSMNLPGIAGSDAHHSSEFGKILTEIQASFDVDSILSSIKKGSVSIPSSVRSIHF